MPIQEDIRKALYERTETTLFGTVYRAIDADRLLFAANNVFELTSAGKERQLQLKIAYLKTRIRLLSNALLNRLGSRRFWGRFSENTRKVNSVEIRPLHLIRQNTPFVGGNRPHLLPFVCYRSPSVGITAFVASSRSGFTLIELMITLVLIGILSALAAPAFSAFIANQRLSSQANELMADLMYARSEAIKRSAQITICKTANPNAASPTCNATDGDGWTSGRLVFLDADNDNDVDAGEPILRIRQALDGSGGPSGNVLLGDGDSDQTANRIIFTAGGATTLPAESELFVCDSRGDAQALAIAVTRTGRARVTAKGKDRSGNNIAACP